MNKPPENKLGMLALRAGEGDMRASDFQEKLEKIVAYARETYAAPSDNDLEIDGNPNLSRGDCGTWVAAWVWVPDHEVNIVDEAEEAA